MAKHIHFCAACDMYTLKTACPSCSSPTVQPRPPKFSLKDKYSSIRRQVKEPELKKIGLL